MRTRTLAATTLLMITLAGCGQDDPLAYSKSQLEFQQQQQAAQRAVNRAAALEPIQRTALSAWWLFVAAVPLVALGIAVDTYVQRRRPLIHPDHAGRLPVPRVMIDSGELAGAMVEALRAYHTTQAIAAAQPRVDKLSVTIKQPDSQQLPASAPPLIASTDSIPTTLPEIVELADVLPTIKQGHLAFGVLPSGELLQLPFARSYHMLGAGDTRTGKTVLLDSMITQLHHMRSQVPLTLYGGDYKRELAATWNRSRLFATIETEPAAIANMLLELVDGPDGVHARYDGFKTLGVEHNRIVRNIADASKITGDRPHIKVVALDEINALIEAAKRNDRVSEALKVLLQTGAGAGVFVLGGAQYLSAQVFSRDGSKQFTSRALFGAYDRTAAAMMFGQSIDPEARPYVTGGPGRGLIRTVAQQHTTAFQALHCSEDDILAAIATVSDACNSSCRPATSASSALETVKPKLPERSVALPQPPQIDLKPAVESATMGAAEVPELERVQIVALAKAGISRGKICEQLYGARGGRGYERVKNTLNAAGL